MGHTKGEWYFNDNAVSNDKGNSIAYIYTNKADGKLIEASPDLLKACKLAEDYFLHLYNTKNIKPEREIWDELKAAISKAEDY